MRKIDRLKREARKAATWRGHKLGRFRSHAYDILYKRIVAADAECEAPKCTAMVTVSTHGAAGQTDIIGDAIAVGCPVTE